jgi:(hydroxyamino)benzene mutase
MDRLNLKEKQSDRLIFSGMLLFFLALLVGLGAPLLANPRLGISCHVEGVLNGIFLVVLGLIWKRIALADIWLVITFWLSVYGTFSNWLGYLIAAIYNAGRHLSIASAGHQGPPLADDVVDFLLVTLTISMLTICTTVIIGLYRNMKNKVLSGKIS